MDSRPSSPEAPPADLWGSILDSVSSSRSIPSKQILLLGQPSTGKSTLAAGLLQKPPADEKEDHATDFAVGYDFANVRDEADEDTLARLSVYTVPSSAPEYTSLLPYFVPPRTALPHTLVMIALDWTRPWTFVEELETWLRWVEKWTRGDGARELEIVREESRERLQAHLQHYSEPSVDPPTAVSSSMSGSTVLPLGPGTLTHNSAGVPIIVVCTKADLFDEGGSDLGTGASGMGGMVRGKGGEWEERTDSIMQVLRTICLKYGAGLFYTTQHPTTLLTLRQYALHMLFLPPAPSLAVASGAEPPAPVRNPFPFTQKPNYLDRDRIVVPAGWDSWGKITIMREEFEARTWGEAWEADLETEGDSPSDGAKALFSALVPDQGVKPTPLPPLNNPTPEQAFLAKNYDENAKRTDRDPRAAFRDSADPMRGAAGLVGPMGGMPSFDLPTVDRVLSEMETGINGNIGAPPPRAAAAPRRPAGLAPSTSPRQPSGPAGGVPTPTSATGGQSQHEVLQSFFDKLLKGGKDRTSASATTTAPKTNGNGNGAAEEGS